MNLFVALLIFMMSSEQIAKSPPADLPTISSEVISVQLVLVPVVVRRSDGFVDNLRRRDFALFVDDRPVPIETFDHRSEAGFSLVVLQDLSGSMANRGRIDVSREVTLFFANRIGRDDEIAIASFADERLRVDVPFTSDQEVVAEAAAVWEGFGVTALHDAVARLPEVTASGSQQPRAAILLTDGADNASQLDPLEAREIVRRADLPVYVFSLDTQKHAHREASNRRYEGLLRSLASASGGRYYEVGSAKDWKESALDVYRILRTRYILGFAASGLGESHYREIRVEVRRHKRGVTARQGYRGTLPAAWTTD